MARKPTDPVKLNLRFTEALRLRLEKQAERNNRSMNEEIVHRLTESFVKEDRRRELEEMADEFSNKMIVRFQGMIRKDGRWVKEEDQ